MKEKNAAISKEQAEMLLKKPETNRIEVTNEVQMKLLLLDIQNRLIHFEEVVIKSIGKSIGKALSAA